MTMTFTLEDALYRLTTDHLKKMIAIHCPRQKPTRKAEMVSALKHTMLNAKHFRSVWDKLDTVQKFAVSEAVHSIHGSFNDDFFEAKYKSFPGFAESPWRNRKGPDSSLANFFLGGGIPDDVKQLIQSFVPEPPLDTLRSSKIAPAVYKNVEKSYSWQEGDEGITVLRRGTAYQIPRQRPKENIKITEIPVTICDTAKNAQYELKTVLHLLETGKVAVSEKTMRPTAAASAVIAKSLTGGDYYPPNSDGPDPGFIKSFAWPILLQAAELAELNGKKLSLTKTGVQAISKPSPETVKQIWKRWLLTRWDEFQRVEAIKGQGGKGAHGMTVPSSRRTVIMNGLSGCPINEWVEISEFSRHLQASKRYFDVSNEPWSLYVLDPNYGALGYDDAHSWEILQERYIKCFLMEYAATLGLVDVAYVRPEEVNRDFDCLWGVDELAFLSRYDGFLSFRVNELGAYCFGLTSTYSKSESKSSKKTISVSSNLRISLTEDSVTPDVALLLDTYAERETQSSWRLEQCKAVAAVERGHQISDLADYLRLNDDQPLPETVEAFLTRVKDNAAALEIKGNAVLIECKNSEVADTIATSACTKHLCQKLDKRTLVVRANDQEQFRKAVHQLGYGVGSRLA